MAKFSVTLKDPDYTTSNGVSDGVSDLSKSDRALVATFLGWNEYVTIEFDTTAKTARVIPVSEMGS